MKLLKNRVIKNYLPSVLVVLALFATQDSNAQIKTTQKISINTQPTFTNFKTTQISKLKKAVIGPVRTSVIKSAPTEVVDVSNTPKYPSPSKPQFTPSIIDADCNALPVSYKTSLPEIALIFPPTNFAAKIYPGAIYPFNEIKNMSFSLYQNPAQRNPMELNTTIFRQNNTSVSEVINTFDFGSVMGKWNALLNRTLQGGSTPGNISSELILAESKSQIRADLNTFSNVDVSVKLSFPIPDLPVSVNVGENVSVSNTTSISSNAENQKNTIILRYSQVFYSSFITPKAGSEDVYAGVDKSTLPEDLLYVSSVDYGQVYYIVVTSTYSKEELMKAVIDKVTTRTELGATVEGLPIEGNVGVGTTNNTDQQTNTVLSSSNTTIKVLQQGGQPMPGMSGTLDDVLNRLKNIPTQFSATNLGAPIKFTLNYVKDHSLAYINYNLAYATANCGKTLAGKFDVEVELEDFVISNVGDLDGTEDLYGSQLVSSAKANNRRLNTQQVFWTKSEAAANTNNFRNGTAQMPEGRKVIFKDLTLDELKHLEIVVGGKLFDDEGVFGSRTFKCVSCDHETGFRTLKLIDYVKTQNSINALIPNGEFQAIKIGDDTMFELHYHESGKPEDGTVKTRWRVWVKPH